MTPATIAAALRATARGLYGPEAAVALLIDHRYWLARPDFLDGFVHTSGGSAHGSSRAAICWPEAVAALDRGQLSGSNSENKILRLAAALAEGIPVDLLTAVTGLDDNNLQRVTIAIRYAAGRRPTASSSL